MSKWWNYELNKFFQTKMTENTTDALGVGFTVFAITNAIWIMFTAIFPNIQEVNHEESKKTLDNLILNSNAFTVKGEMQIDEYTLQFEKDIKKAVARQ